jgi:hypothetical protein
MIVLAWRFWTATADGDAWFDHCDRTALPDLTAADTNQGVFVLWRNQGGQTEFLVLSFWDAESSPNDSAAVQRALDHLATDRWAVRREIDARAYEAAGRGAIALTASLSLDD